MRHGTLPVIIAALIAGLSACTTPAGEGRPDPIDLHSISWHEIGTPGAHDPTLTRTPTGWYLYYTGHGILSKWSPDGVHWLLNGSVFDETPEWTAEYVQTPSSNIWAPDISYVNGRYHLYYSVSTFGENDSVIGLATNATLDRESERFEWIDEGHVVSSRTGDSYNAIDPNLIIDTDGQPWLAFGSHWSGIKLVRLDRATMKPRADAELLPIAARPGSTAIEAPAMTHRDGWYYLFVSFDQCCRGVLSTYKIAVGRSRSVDGPYVDRDGVPMLEGGGTIVLESGERWKGPGHNAVYREGEQYILVHHAYDGENNGAATLRIKPIEWDDEGWPRVERRGP